MQAMGMIVVPIVAGGVGATLCGFVPTCLASGPFRWSAFLIGLVTGGGIYWSVIIHRRQARAKAERAERRAPPTR